MNDDIRENNHQVTGSILRNWLDYEGQIVGINFYDISDQKKKFSKGKDTRFAIIPYLYVPMTDSGRDDIFERDLSKDEDHLGRLIKSTQDGRENLIRQDTAQKAIRACVSLGCRSGYYSLVSALALSQSGIEKEKLHYEVVEITKRTIDNMWSRFQNWKFVIIKNLNSDLLLNEQPFRDQTSQANPTDFVSMALTPRMLLIGKPSSSGKFELVWADNDQAKINVDEYNRYTIATARLFVLAKTEAQLDKIIPSLEKCRLEERISRDKIVANFKLRSNKKIYSYYKQLYLSSTFHTKNYIICM